MRKFLRLIGMYLGLRMCDHPAPCNWDHCVRWERDYA